MTITKKSDGGALTLLLEGRLDTNTAPQLEQELSESLPGVKTLTLDLKELVYISSAGLRVVLSTQKKMNRQGQMIVRNVNEEVMEVFEMTGFVDVLRIE